LHLGFFGSIVLFAVVIPIPAVAWSRFNLYDVQSDDGHHVHPNRLPRLMTETA